MFTKLSPPPDLPPLGGGGVEESSPLPGLIGVVAEACFPCGKAQRWMAEPFSLPRRGRAGRGNKLADFPAKRPKGAQL